tara:strand:+ start:819 stop:2081 length:1263 start_codon:yes stop_codon:yes gene_type:complete
MFIIIRLEHTGQNLRFNINENQTILHLKKDIQKKTNIPIIRQKLIHSLKILEDNKKLSDHNIKENDTIRLKIIMGAFGLQKKPPLDINSFIIENTHSYLSDIIVFIWGNAITINRNITEYTTSPHSNLHDIFRQQLPLPILKSAYNDNKNITIYSVDGAFSDLGKYDIRNILLEFTKPVTIDKVELYRVPIDFLLKRLNVPINDNQFNSAIISLYFIPYVYGYCELNKNNKTDTQLCIQELKNHLNNLVHEYYIYGQSLDINTLHTRSSISSHNLKTWFNKTGGKNKLPKHYTANLTKKDKKKQIKNIKRSSKAYRKGKYINRPKLKSYTSKKSSWVTKFENKYGKNIKSYKDIEKATGIPAKALIEVVKKGKGAYYSSGSRPNQTATSWGKARMYSYIMGGPTRKIDQHITDKYNVKLP